MALCGKSSAPCKTIPTTVISFETHFCTGRGRRTGTAIRTSEVSWLGRLIDSKELEENEFSEMVQSMQLELNFIKCSNKSFMT